MTNDIGRFSTAPAPAPAPGEAETPADKPAEEQKPAELVYGSAEEFLHEQLLPTYVRDVDGRAAPRNGASSGTSTPKRSPA
jgi:hypothetical protein